MYHTEPPTDKTIREWYMNSSRVAACALRKEQAVRAHAPGRQFPLDLHTVRPLRESDYTRCCISTILPPDDKHEVLRNM